jgi:hypothetical protein
MTEAEWLACTDPRPMLEFLSGTNKVSNRKVKLFAAACVRCVWHLLTDDRIRAAAEAAERGADGRATFAELRSLSSKSAAALKALDRGNDEAYVAAPSLKKASINASIAADWLAHIGRHSRWPKEPFLATDYVVGAVADAIFYTEYEGPNATELTRLYRIEDDSSAGIWWKPIEQRQAGLLRDVFGPLPFRPLSTDSQWLTWNDSTVIKLAQAIYEERAFDRLPILADALEEAGCSNPDILAHCRGPGPHVRGCWVVDLLLGKE